MDVIITSLGEWTLWMKGRAGDYLFQASVTERPSYHGINGGRVTKLAVYKHHWSLGRQFIIVYDKGWDMVPETIEHQRVYQAIMVVLDRKG